ncbi:MAG: DsbA family protein [Roseinatronobacter sp.]
MSLPISDGALIGSCLAASALGLVFLTSSGGNGNAAPEPAAVVLAEAPGASTQDAAPEALGAMAQPDAVAVDPEFAAQVRAFLLDNPEVIFEAVAVFEERQAMAQAEMDVAILEANADALFNDGFSWVGGNPDGDITLVEFMDYRCGFCRRAHYEIQELLDADPNVRLIIKELPILGPESEIASRFAVSVLRLAGDDAYAEVHEMLLRYEGPISPDFLSDLSDAFELDFATISTEMGSEEVTRILMENRALAQRLQISGTPTFVMETEMIRGFVDADVLIETANFLREE